VGIKEGQGGCSGQRKKGRKDRKTDQSTHHRECHQKKTVGTPWGRIPRGELKNFYRRAGLDEKKGDGLGGGSGSEPSGTSRKRKTEAEKTSRKRGGFSHRGESTLKTCPFNRDLHFMHSFLPSVNQFKEGGIARRNLGRDRRRRGLKDSINPRHKAGWPRVKEDPSTSTLFWGKNRKRLLEPGGERGWGGGGGGSLW